MSSQNGILKMIFLFPRRDMLIPWRVVEYILYTSKEFKRWLFSFPDTQIYGVFTYPFPPKITSINVNKSYIFSCLGCFQDLSHPHHDVSQSATSSNPKLLRKMGTWRGPAFLVPAPGASSASTRTSTPSRGASVTLAGEVRFSGGWGERPCGFGGWFYIGK